MAMAFPITRMSVDHGTLARLNSTDLDTRVWAATQTLLPSLRAFFNNESAFSVQVNPSDLSIATTFPDENVDSSCGHRIDALNNRCAGTLLSSSYLRFTGAVDWGAAVATIVAEAALDAQLRLETDVRLETGVKLLGKCRKLAQKTVGVDVTSSGKNNIGIKFSAKNARLELIPQLALVFNLDITVISLILDWNVNNIDVSRCDIDILGIRIGSVCGFLTRLIRGAITDYTGHLYTIESPALAVKLQRALQSNIGDEIRIPLLLSQPSNLVNAK